MKLATFKSALKTFCALSIALPNPIYFASRAQANDKTIDVSGSRGQDGRGGSHGSSGSSGYWGGGNGGSGGDGGDAGSATPGTNAGSIHIVLERPKVQQQDQAFAGSVVIRGTVKASSGHTSDPNQTLKIGSTGRIHLLAVGGDGGHGGVGGDGGRGGDGGNGTNATRYSSGGSGGNGGRGGDGGDGTSGENAGHGGFTSATVSDRDTDLLMLIGQVNVHGGRGGNAGRNGSGGSGGSGGWGGSSYSWTEESCSYNSKGERSCTTTSHSNPGGWNGSSGSSGSSGSAYLTAGRSGENGNFKIRVTSPEGAKEYTRRFDLAVVSFDMKSDNNDGIFEPGEGGTISKIRVRNTGGMPTPPNYPVEVSLPNGSWLKSRWEKLVIHKSLAPGEELLLDGTLRFDLRDVTAAQTGDRFKSTDVVNQRGTQKGVDRDYERFTQSRQYEVTFPIEITPITTSLTLLPGDTSKLFWKVKNVSNIDFGRLSDIKREIGTMLKLDPDVVSTSEFQFKDAKGGVVSLSEGFFTTISHLKAGQEMVIEGFVSLKPTAIPYTKVGLKSDVTLGKIDKPEETRPIQYRDVVINVGRVFKKTAGSKILIITNNQTTKEELDAWMEVVASLGMVADVWDSNYEGFLEFHRLLSYTNKTLAQDFPVGTVVMLNNDRPLKSRPGFMVQADAMIPKRDLLKAAAGAKINFYMVGKTKQHNDDIISFFLMPSGGEQVAETTSMSKLVKDVKDKVGPTGSGRVGDLHLTETWVIREPSREYMEKKARELEKKLQRQFPDRRFFVVHQLNGERTENNWVLDKYKSGRIEVFQTLPETETSITALAVDNKTMHQPGFVKGPRNIQALLMAMPLEEKLKLFVEALEGKNAYVQQLKNALLIDIATEQSHLRSKSTNSGLKEKMPVLKTILARLIEHADLSKGTDDMVDFLAKIQLVADSHFKLWAALFDAVPFVSSVNNWISHSSRTLVQSAIREMHGEKTGHWPEGLNSRYAVSSGLKPRALALAKRTMVSRFESAVFIYRHDLGKGVNRLADHLAPSTDYSVTRDSEQRFDRSSRVLSRDDYDAAMRSRSWVKENQQKYEKRRIEEKRQIEELNRQQGQQPTAP